VGISAKSLRNKELEDFIKVFIFKDLNFHLADLAKVLIINRDFSKVFRIKELGRSGHRDLRRSVEVPRENSIPLPWELGA
jgi:hypothetical protein